MKTRSLLFYLLFLPLLTAVGMTFITCLLRLAYFTLPDAIADIWSVVDALTDYLLDGILYFGFGLASVLILFGTKKQKLLCYPFILILPILLPVFQFFIRFLMLFNNIPSSQFEELFYSDFLTVLTKTAGSILFGLCSVAFLLHARKTGAVPKLSLAPTSHGTLIPFCYFAAMTVLTVITCVTGSTEILSSLYAIVSFAVGYFLSYLGARVAFPSVKDKMPAPDFAPAASES